MPSYNQHRFFNYFLFLTALLIGIISFKSFSFQYSPLLFITFCIGYYFGTDYITPDLDIDSKVYQRWGILKLVWWPYKVIFKHRQSSHNIVFSAVIRIIYISIILSILGILIFGTKFIFNIDIGYTFAFFAGIIVANTFHVLLDTIL